MPSALNRTQHFIPRTEVSCKQCSFFSSLLPFLPFSDFKSFLQALAMKKLIEPSKNLTSNLLCLYTDLLWFDFAAWLYPEHSHGHILSDLFLLLSAVFWAFIPDLKSLLASSAKSSPVSDSLVQEAQRKLLIPSKYASSLTQRFLLISKQFTNNTALHQ